MRERQGLIPGIYDENREQSRGLGDAGVLADPVYGTRILDPSLAGAITFDAATGRPRADGKPGAAAVTLTGDDGRVMAAVVSPLGNVSAWVRSGGDWRAR